MNYRQRMHLLILLDSLIVFSTVYVAAWIVYPSMNIYSTRVTFLSAFVLLLSHHVFANIFKLYHKVWAYASIGELIAVVKAVTLSVAVTGTFQFIINDLTVYRRALVITWVFHTMFIGGSRFIWRIIREQYTSVPSDYKRTIIIGAGSAGAMIARQLLQGGKSSELYPIGFLDDSPDKQHLELYSLPVIGTTENIEEVVKKERVDQILIAIPSLNNGKLKALIDKCNQTDANVQILPRIEDLASGKVTVNQLRKVDVEDVLGRAPVELNSDLIEQEIGGKTILVTGAGGSIGSEITRQLMSFKPKTVILLGHGEYSIYQIDMALKHNPLAKDIEIIPVIADVQDRRRVFEVVNEYQPDYIYHAAAHKHVPLMEANPHEAVKNNIIGTKNVAQAADYYGVKRFVLVSTDKAVNPTNVMGATKRIAEMIIQSFGEQSQTTFTAVRFGNVLGSRGSVIPLFKKQIEQGGPVTVTDPNMTRYFMTIPEASRLVIQASVLAKGAEVFVLDMGEPIKIVDLAKNLIKLSGFQLDDIEIIYTGIRPGEKMYEELLNKDEILPEAVYDKIYVGRTKVIPSKRIDDLLAHFLTLTPSELKEQLMAIVFDRTE